MNCVEFSDNDVYFMEVLEDIVVINDNYQGILLLNSSLEQIGSVKIFERLCIDSSFWQGKKLLLSCPENDCLVYLDFGSNEKKMISLKGFEEWIFSPLYIWQQDRVIVSDYSGHFADVDLQKGQIYGIHIEDLAYQELREDILKLRDFQICKICKDKKRAIVSFRGSKIGLIDYAEGVKVACAFEAEPYHDYEWNEDYIAKIGEDKVEIIHENDRLFYCPTKGYYFLRGKIAGKGAGKSLFLLSGLKSDSEKSRIDRMKLD